MRNEAVRRNDWRETSVITGLEGSVTSSTLNGVTHLQGFVTFYFKKYDRLHLKTKTLFAFAELDILMSDTSN